MLFKVRDPEKVRRLKLGLPQWGGGDNRAGQEEGGGQQSNGRNGEAGHVSQQREDYREYFVERRGHAILQADHRLHGSQFFPRTEQDRNVVKQENRMQGNQSWDKDGQILQKSNLKGTEQECGQSRADILARKRLWEKGRVEKEDQLKELQLPQMEGRFNGGGAGNEERGLGGEVVSAEDSCWRKWLLALEEDKKRLMKLWRGGVIRHEEYLRRKRKLLDEKVEEETRLLEKLLIGGSVEVEEFRRRKEKLNVHKSLLESYQDELPGDMAGHHVINEGQETFKNAKDRNNEYWRRKKAALWRDEAANQENSAWENIGKSKAEDDHLRRQQDLDEKEKMLSALWRDRVQMEEDWKVREGRLIEEQKKIHQGRQDCAALGERYNYKERQREEELRKKEELLEEFRQERIERENDLKIREEKLMDEKKMLESDKEKHESHRKRNASCSKSWDKRKADVPRDERFDGKRRKVDEGSLTRVDKVRKEDAQVLENVSQTRPMPVTRSSCKRSTSRRRSASRREYTLERTSERKSTPHHVDRSRPRSQSRLRTAPQDSRTPSRRRSSLRSSKTDHSKGRSDSRRRSNSRRRFGSFKRLRTRQSISPRKVKPLGREKRSSSRAYDNPGRGCQVGEILVELPNDEVELAHESSPVRRVALLSSPARTRSNSRECSFRVPVRLRLGSSTPTTISGTYENSVSPRRPRTLARSRSRSRSRTSSKSRSRSRSRTPARSRLGPRVPVKARLGLKRDVKWRLGARRRVREKGLAEKNFLFSTLDQVEIFWVNPSISG